VSNQGNQTSGREDLDRPFKKRRRGLGQKNADGVTRADYVALRLGEARTLREMAEIAISLGAYPRLINMVLSRDVRNSVKVLDIHRITRACYNALRDWREKKSRKRFAKRITTGKPGTFDTGGHLADTQYGIPNQAPVRRGL
jgi:hypothetical protein